MKGSSEGPNLNRRVSGPSEQNSNDREVANVPAARNNGDQANDEVMEVFGDTPTNVVVAILALLAWLSAYTAYQNCTC